MKIIDCEQRSQAWFEARLGIPTASSIGKIITASGKDRKGATPHGYMLSLLGERLTRTPSKAFETSAMARGRELEPMARAWYSETTGEQVREIGFAVHDNGLCGCSPDGLCASRGLEIKCPQLPAFLDYATTGEMPDDYYVQVQASMWITGLPQWDFLVYTDVRGLQPILKTIPADYAFISAMAEAVVRFCAKLDELEEAMRALGHGVPRDTPVDLSALQEDVPDMDGMEITDFSNQ